MYVRIFGVGKSVCDLTNDVETTLKELKTQIKAYNQIVCKMTDDDTKLRNDIAKKEEQIIELEKQEDARYLISEEKQKEIADAKQEVEDLSLKTMDIDDDKYPEFSLCDFPIFQDMQIVIERASFICSQIAEQIELNKTTNETDTKLVEAQAIVDRYKQEEKEKELALKAKKKRIAEAYKAQAGNKKVKK